MDVDGFILPSECDDDSYSGSNMDFTNGGMANETEQNEIHENGDEFSLETCSETLKEILDKYKIVKTKLKERNALAQQLAYGIYLQSEMDKCRSTRQNFPIHLQFEVRNLSSGSSLFLLNLHNDAEITLLDWSIVLTINLFSAKESSDADLLKTFTKSVLIGQLSKGCDFTTEIFCTETTFSSWLVRPQLMKVLPLSDESHVFRVDLDASYYSLWNEIRIINSINSGGDDLVQQKTDRAASYQLSPEEQTLNLPEALVFLLCGGDATPHSFLKWVLLSNSVSSSDVRCKCRYKNQLHTLTVTVVKYSKSYAVIMKVKDRDLRTNLLKQLQTRILVDSCSLRRLLKEKADCEILIDGTSLMSYFESYVSRFVT